MSLHAPSLYNLSLAQNLVSPTPDQMKNNGLVKLVYVADVSKYLIEFACGKIKNLDSLANVSAGCCLLPELYFLP